MQEYVSRFGDYLKYERSVSQHTLRNYLSDLDQFRDFLCPKDSEGNRSDIDVSQIDHIQVRGYIARLYEEKRKKSSIARKLAALRAFFQFLCRERVIESNPARLVSSPKLEKRLPRTASVNDLIRLIESPDSDTTLGKRDRAILELLYATGSRVAELAGMNLGDIDFKNQMILVRGKGGKERYVPFGGKAAAALRDYLEVRAELLLVAPLELRDSPAVFLNRLGTRLTTRSIGRLVEKYVRECALAANISPHALRHSCATHMLSGGADLLVIQEMLGHAKLSSTQIYTHVSIEHLMKVYDKTHPKANG
jgi:integrase/recombinase XerC